MRILYPQTHFIGVLANEALADTLGQCRLWMGENFGCRSGFSTPMHVTLVPPFALADPGDVEALERAIDACARAGKAFQARVAGFGAFAERTVFARVEPDPRWTELRDSLYATIARALPGRIRKDARPFVPHLTVANRDIPAIAVPRALEYFAHLGLEEDFPADHIALFTRKGGVWATERAWKLGKKDPAGTER
jgi:2'-5' RNA ligase